MTPPFKWFHTFMNTPEEWHAFVIGWGDGVAFTTTEWQKVEEIKGEGQYYKFGLALGRFSIFGFMAGMIKVVIA